MSVVANKNYRLLIKSAKQIVQVVRNGELFLYGPDQNNLSVLHAPSDDQGLSLVVNNQGYIELIGSDTEVSHMVTNCTIDETIDASGKVIIPGLVDAHTHPVWVGDRVNEFAMKLDGATYLDIHKAGGGIHFTVRHVQTASEEELFRDLKKYLLRMLRSGTTLVECKTGYGLTLEAELKMLRVIERAIRDAEIAIELSVTYCAAHAVPIGKTAEEATLDIIENQLPEIQKQRICGQLHVDNIDVFCEEGVFNVDQTRRILQAGIDIGLNANFHAEELNCLHSAEMGAQLNSSAMSHLEKISREGIDAMGRSKSVAVLLPTTAHILRLEAPPARDLIQSGVPVALGSDFNPNAHCFAMPIVMHLACIQLKMNMREVLVAGTINSAASLRKSSTHGSLEKGKLGDMLIIDADRWEHLIYQYGSFHHLIKYVIKHGRIVHRS